MEPAPQPKRRWLRFSLRTLLVVMLLLGCGLGWVGMQLQQKRRHEAVVKEIEKLGGKIDSTAPIPAWKGWLFGVYAVESGNADLSETDATDSILAQMKGMECEGLFLASTKITDDGLVHLLGMTSLRWLSLRGTQITDDGLANLRGITNLTMLSLSDTQVTDAGLAHLQEMTTLESLNLSNTQVTGSKFEHLKGMTSLKWLSLGGTQITDAGLQHLKGMLGLQTLYLYQTQVTDTGLLPLHGLINLRELHVVSTSVTQDGLDRLQKAIPGCTITIETTSDSAPP